MKKFRVTEIRENDKGEQFAVDTYCESESREELKRYIDNSKPSWIKDKNYRIKEVEELCRK